MLLRVMIHSTTKEEEWEIWHNESGKCKDIDGIGQHSSETGGKEKGKTRRRECLLSSYHVHGKKKIEKKNGSLKVGLSH